jgi:outer membrane protein assembly factor BamB
MVLLPEVIHMRRVLVACCLVCVSLAGRVQADNWPQWRGPSGDGICKETNLPSEWADNKNIAWKLKLPGMAGSTPCIWDERIFLTSEDGNDLVLVCISTKGKELWKRTIGSGKTRARKDEGNGASSSPSTDGKLVFALVGSGDFACFDFDGKEVWKFNVEKRYGKVKLDFGMHSTPVLDGDRLYFQLIGYGIGRVVAINKADGSNAWNVERKSDGRNECENSYASPVLWRNGKDAYLVTHGNDYAIAHRLTDGSEIWRLGDLNPKSKYNQTLRFVASPVAVADLIVVPSAKNGPVVGVKPAANGLIMQGGTGEQWRRSSNTPDVPSPLVQDGLVYLARENGFLICMDAKSGREHYNQRIHPDRYRASPVYADGKIYVTARDGTITVVKAGTKFEQVAVNKLSDETTASPAISNGRIYIRGFQTLYAIGKK